MFIEQIGYVSIELVVNEHTEQLNNELVDFWLKEQVIATEFEARARVNEVATIARDANNNIVGVNSFFEDYSNLLENHFIHHRSFVDKEHPLFRSA